MRKTVMASIISVLLGCCSCKQELLEFRQGDLQVHIEEGSAWLHHFPLMLGIKVKNPPQVAIWMEDTQGHYLSTVYVTHKIATQSWTAAGGNRRKEALPHWCYARGVKYADGLYLPTKKQPLTDALTGATSTSGFDVRLRPNAKLKQFVVKIEVNHSTDFNDHYPKAAQEGEAGYSGGKSGSGQPSVVYAAQVDTESGKKEFEAVLIGHSSPDGSNGSVDPDTSTLTTALDIVKRITVSIR